jgi:hypothetical protein
MGTWAFSSTLSGPTINRLSAGLHWDQLQQEHFTTPAEKLQSYPAVEAEGLSGNCRITEPTSACMRRKTLWSIGAISREMQDWLFAAVVSRYLAWPQMSLFIVV